jgi:hypothetical protein
MEDQPVSDIPDFALLAPVPLRHLQSGAEVAQREGFVAFGTTCWELLRDLDVLREGSRVPVLVYASHAEDGEGEADVTWAGWYVGSTESRGGAHPQGMKHRPPTTASDKAGHWAVFWHVTDLRELPPQCRQPIATLRNFKSRKPAKGAAVLRMRLVDPPAFVHDL